MTFSGFPPRSHYTPVPNLFFTSLLPQIGDLAELKVTLYVFWLLSQKKGYPRFVTYPELLGERPLLQGLGEAGSLRAALEKAVARGALLRLAHEGHELLFSNTEEGRRALERIRGGELPSEMLRGLPPEVSGEPSSAPPPPGEGGRNIFTLYEENISLLTPLIAEELKEAEGLYPPAWIEEAFREAVSRNKRSWRYIARILERWEREGRDHGDSGGHPEEKPWQKYFQGKYGRLLR